MLKNIKKCIIISRDFKRGIKMEEYFEEVENKKNKKKIILIVIFALLFIAAFSILGIKLAEDYNKK